MKVNVVGHFENGETEHNQLLRYVDNGCKGAKELGYFGPCTGCTFVKCLEDTGESLKKEKIKLRNNEIINQRLRGVTIKDIAAYFNVNHSTVKRILRNRPVLASN